MKYGYILPNHLKWRDPMISGSGIPRNGRTIDHFSPSRELLLMLPYGSLIAFSPLLLVTKIPTGETVQPDIFGGAVPATATSKQKTKTLINRTLITSQSLGSLQNDISLTLI